jgi:hypothetical protein
MIGSPAGFDGNLVLGIVHLLNNQAQDGDSDLINFLNGVATGAATDESAASPGPGFLTGSMPPKSGRPQSLRSPSVLAGVPIYEGEEQACGAAFFKMSRSTLTLASSRRMRSYSWLDTFSLLPLLTGVSPLTSLHERPNRFAPTPTSRPISALVAPG